jgi:FSR family fosmidomycin resistance protein-like MFS transporter
VGFGHLADRWRPRTLIRVGPIVSVTLLSLVGLAQTKLALAAILIAGGLGAAAFHPPAAALAHRLGGDRRGFAMSVYITGGTLGFSLGPLLFAPFAQRFGIEWTPLLAIPGLAVVIFFVRRVPPIPVHPSGHGGFTALRPYAKPLGLLYAIVVLRTLTSLTFATFVPVMLTRRGLSVGEAGASVALYLFGSGVGGFFGGPAADRFGARRVIALSLVASCPFLFIAPFLTGWAFVVVLAIGGLFLQSTLPVNVTFGQSLAPVSAATVSSLMMGFAWGTGGLSVPFVGMIADRVGIEHTLVGVSVIPLLAAACALPLPAHARASTAPQPAEVIVPETRP